MSLSSLTYFYDALADSRKKSIQAITREVMRDWKIGTTLRVHPIVQSISLQVILKAVFGVEDGSRYENLRSRLTQLLGCFGSPTGAMLLFYPFLRKDWGAWSPWGRFIRLQRQVDDLLYDEITER